MSNYKLSSEDNAPQNLVQLHSFYSIAAYS
jgi:hypothetical protein